MLIIIIFAICSAFLLFIQNMGNQLIYQNLHQKDQLKSLAAFVRSSDNLSKIRLEEELGISESFFDKKTIITNNAEKNDQYIPYDFIITTDNTPYETFLNSKNTIIVNDQRISAQMLKHYSKCFSIYRNTPNICAPSIWNVF